MGRASIEVERSDWHFHRVDGIMKKNIRRRFCIRRKHMDRGLMNGLYHWVLGKFAYTPQLDSPHTQYSQKKNLICVLVFFSYSPPRCLVPRIREIWNRLWTGPWTCGLVSFDLEEFVLDLSNGSYHRPGERGLFNDSSSGGGAVNGSYNRRHQGGRE